jgi:hypothetical protein
MLCEIKINDSHKKWEPNNTGQLSLYSAWTSVLVVSEILNILQNLELKKVKTNILRMQIRLFTK